MVFGLWGPFVQSWRCHVQCLIEISGSGGLGNTLEYVWVLLILFVLCCWLAMLNRQDFREIGERIFAGSLTGWPLYRLKYLKLTARRIFQPLFTICSVIGCWLIILNL